MNGWKLTSVPIALEHSEVHKTLGSLYTVIVGTNVQKVFVYLVISLSHNINTSAVLFDFNEEI